MDSLEVGWQWLNLTPSQRPEQEAGNGQNDEDKKQKLGNACGTCGNTTKTEQGSDQGNDNENNSVVQHGQLELRLSQAAKAPMS